MKAIEKLSKTLHPLVVSRYRNLQFHKWALCRAQKEETPLRAHNLYPILGAWMALMTYLLKRGIVTLLHRFQNGLGGFPYVLRVKQNVIAGHQGFHVHVDSPA